MSQIRRTEVTEILARIAGGEPPGPDRTTALFAAAYDELHRIASRLMRGERNDHTLQPTALVHEAFLRLVDQSRVDWRGQAHFLGIAARAMRQILIDHARRHGAAKRAGDWERITLDEDVVKASPPVNVLRLHAALEALAERDERLARVAELRIFAAATVNEIACVLSVSPRTVDGDWSLAKAWLLRQLESIP